ncbi:MAG: endonuclease III [Desulfovibrionaceae bacterium]|nr:endonuclease III [Desulfovibrionaceae bacterium]
MKNNTPSQQAQLVLEKLKARYPELQTHLVAANPWQLMIATILAAQCTDARVNTVTPQLFSRWPDAAALGAADIAEVESVIRSTGFYHNKAKNIIAAGKVVSQRFGGTMPSTLEELITIPGVARKTANCVLWGGFGINVGLAVDTHVKRIAYRLGLTKQTDPVAVERDLMALFPQAEWGGVNHRMVWFGRHVCDARKPLCEECEMAAFCPRLEPPKSKK